LTVALRNYFIKALASDGKWIANCLPSGDNLIVFQSLWNQFFQCICWFCYRRIHTINNTYTISGYFTRL